MITGGSTQARDEIFRMVQTVWDDGADDFEVTVGDPPVAKLPRLYWQGEELSAPPQVGVPHAKAHVVHQHSRQAGIGGDGSKLFVTTGYLLIECHGPMGSGKGLTIAEGLATICKDAFRGRRSSPGGIIFRNARINEVGSADGWYQVNMQVDFSYEEVKNA